MERPPLTNVIFEGRKTFWKTKNAVRIVLVDHDIWNVIEIITFDSVLNVEGQRLYVNKKMLKEVLCPVQSRSVFSLFANKVEQTAEIRIMIDFLFNSLIITEYLPITKVFKVWIRANFLDSSTAMVNSFVDSVKPVNLISFPVGLMAG